MLDFAKEKIYNQLREILFHWPKKMTRKIVLSICGLVLTILCSYQLASASESCTMPRIPMNGTARAKQAVYMRSMPCMMEGEYVATAKSQELMTILQESDGRYKLKRADGTIGRIYTTRLIDIKASNGESPAEQPTEPTLTQAMKDKLDLFVQRIKATATSSDKIELFKLKLMSLRGNGNGLVWLMIDYVLDGLK